MRCFFFNDTATTEIYTLSLHDALPILQVLVEEGPARVRELAVAGADFDLAPDGDFKLGREAAHSRNRIVHARSEEHTSELQSRQYLVCRLLLEKNKTSMIIICGSDDTA